MIPSALSDLTYELPVESLKIAHEAECHTRKQDLKCGTAVLTSLPHNGVAKNYIF